VFTNDVIWVLFLSVERDSFLDGHPLVVELDHGDMLDDGCILDCLD